MNIAEQIIVKLPYESKRESVEILRKLKNIISWIKIDQYHYGILDQDYFGKIKRVEEFNLLFDLRLFNEPEIIRILVPKLVLQGANMITLHTLGGQAMLEAAVAGANEIEEKYGIERRPKLIGITIPSHWCQTEMHDTLDNSQSLSQKVANLAYDAREAGLDGILCGYSEISTIIEVCGDNFIIITPQLRDTLIDFESNPVKLIVPRICFNAGADYVITTGEIVQAINSATQILNIEEEKEEAAEAVG